MIRKLRRAKTVSRIVSGCCVAVSFLMMAGVDGGRWVTALLSAIIFMGLAWAATVVSEEYEHRIRKLTRFDPWVRR